MARVPYLDQQDLAAEHRDLLKRSVNIVRALANSPNGLREAFNALSNFIRFKSRLDPRLREELAILMVGYVTRSPYELVAMCRSAGGSACPTRTSAP